ncbi:hypothetical protein B7463_g8352, partial [Scytalidium lignicola]
MEPPSKKRRFQYREEQLYEEDERDSESAELRVSGSGSARKDEKKACTTSNDKGGSDEELEDENRTEDDEFQSDDESQSSSYISDAVDSEDEFGVHERYLQRQEDQYMDKAYKKAEEYEKKKEMVLEKAHSALEAERKAGKSIPIGPTDGGRWDLYSTEYLTHYFIEQHLGKKLHLYYNAVDLPRMDIELVFLGNGYLKLRVELNVLIREESSPKHARKPEIIEFSGIWISNEELKREREAYCASRMPSPEDSIASRLCGWD